MLQVTGVTAGETILLHGAAGAVGSSVLQQARRLGARVIGTASPGNFPLVAGYGGVPVSYREGLADQVRAAAPEGIAAALDTTGSDAAVDISLALVPSRQRVVTTAAFGRARAGDFLSIGAANPESAAYRARERPRIIRLAADGFLEVRIAQEFAFGRAPAALAALTGPHPAGKLALVANQPEGSA
jgi:NADPH:quinone reductase-like Zn-dependent oxidoreductase